MGVSPLVPDVIDTTRNITAVPVESKPSYDDLFPELTEKSSASPAVQAKPATQPTAQPSAETTPKTTPTEETVTLPASAAKRLLKVAWIQENQTLEKGQIAADWLAENPSFYDCEDNWREMVVALQEADLPVTKENLTTAFRALDRQQLLEHNDGDAALRTDQLKIRNDRLEAERREQARAEEIRRHPVRTAMFESTAQPPVPISEPDFSNLAEEIATMPLEQARARMLAEMRKAHPGRSSLVGMGDGHSTIGY